MHIAIIMDGNGRWGLKHEGVRTAGHIRGEENLRAIIDSSIKNKITELSVFAFSRENNERHSFEVKFIYDLFCRSLGDELPSFAAKNLRIRIIGERSNFNSELLATIKKVEDQTSANNGLKLNILFNYGAKWEIAEACSKIGSIEQINEDNINQNLDLGTPDLLIRTGGQCRLSNFMLWQLAYTELYFSDILWPDFNEEELLKAINWFGQQKRNFGKISVSA